MRKIILGLLILLGLGATELEAQIADKLLPYSGLNYQFVRQFDLLGSGQEFQNSYYTFGLGTYYAAIHRNDVVSAGLDAGVNFGFSFPRTATGTRATIFTQVPVLLMGRVGAGATKYNEQGIGFGAGIGGTFTYFNNFDSRSVKYRTSFVNPAVAAQVMLRNRGGVLMIRGTFSLAQVESDFNFDDGTTFRFGLSSWGIGILTSF